MADPDLSGGRLAERFAQLRSNPGPAFRGPGPDAAIATARRRRRSRTAALAAVLVAVLVGAGVTVRLATEPDTLRPVNPPAPATSAPSLPAGPSPSARPSGSPTPSGPSSSTPSGDAAPSRRQSPTSGRVTSLRRTDWRNAILNLPAWNSTCTATRLQFAGGQATAPHPDLDPLRYDMLPYGRDAAYGDLTGDGVEEAVIAVRCVGTGPIGRNATNGEYLPAVVAYTPNAKGGPRLLALVLDANSSTGPEYSIAGGVVTVNPHLINAGSDSNRTKRFRWNGSAFVQVG